MEHLLEEWDYEKNGTFSPQTLSFASTVKVWWHCKVNSQHVWQTPIYSRTTHKRSCPFCKGIGNATKLIRGMNDLETWCKQNHKETILQFWDYDRNDGLKPVDVPYMSSKKVYWVCPSGHSFIRSVKVMTTRSRMPLCNQCNNFENWCISHSYEHILKEWSPKNNIKPSDVPFMSSVNIYWVCDKGHEWVSPLKTRLHKLNSDTDYSISQCPICTHKQVSVGVNDFETWCKETGSTVLLTEWSPENTLKPVDVMPFSNRQIKWVCHNNPAHKWQTSLSYRSHLKIGCPFCRVLEKNKYAE